MVVIAFRAMIGLPASEFKSDPASYKLQDKLPSGVTKDSPFPMAPHLRQPWESGHREGAWLRTAQDRVQCGVKGKGLLASESPRAHGQASLLGSGAAGALAEADQQIPQPAFLAPFLQGL